MPNSNVQPDQDLTAQFRSLDRRKLAVAMSRASQLYLLKSTSTHSTAREIVGFLGPFLLSGTLYGFWRLGKYAYRTQNLPSADAVMKDESIDVLVTLRNHLISEKGGTGIYSHKYLLIHAITGRICQNDTESHTLIEQSITALNELIEHQNDQELNRVERHAAPSRIYF